MWDHEKEALESTPEWRIKQLEAMIAAERDLVQRLAECLHEIESHRTIEGEVSTEDSQIVGMICADDLLRSFGLVKRDGKWERVK